MQLKSLIKNIGIVLITVLLTVPVFAFSATTEIEKLNNQIESQRKAIEQINREIAQKQEELKKVGAEKSTLLAAIKQLEKSRSKIESDIKLTQKKINTAELTLQKISFEIKDKEKEIQISNKALAESIRNINNAESESLLEIILNNKNISSVWDGVETLIRFNTNIQEFVDQLRGHKRELEVHKNETEENKKLLVNYQKELSGQKQAIEASKNEKNVILTKTQSKEAEYQKLLTQKIAQKEAFEKELFNYEAQLKIAIDPTKIPGAKSGVLLWPLSSIRITQYFGKTVDAKRLYASGTHNGIDFAAADRTPILAASSGTVQAIGNTDGGGCYSYGKWILLKHPNGLSTLYGHLSSFAVSSGDIVSAGQVIGYSGRTGYATGPHLHFTVYASEGVRVQQYTTSINCKNKIIPMADQKAYIDPMLYLPH